VEISKHFIVCFELFLKIHNYTFSFYCFDSLKYNNHKRKANNEKLKRRRKQIENQLIKINGHKPSKGFNKLLESSSPIPNDKALIKALNGNNKIGDVRNSQRPGICIIIYCLILI